MIKQGEQTIKTKPTSSSPNGHCISSCLQVPALCELVFEYSSRSSKTNGHSSIAQQINVTTKGESGEAKTLRTPVLTTEPWVCHVLLFCVLTHGESSPNPDFSQGVIIFQNSFLLGGHLSIKISLERAREMAKRLKHWLL